MKKLIIVLLLCLSLLSCKEVIKNSIMENLPMNSRRYKVNMSGYESMSFYTFEIEGVKYIFHGGSLLQIREDE